MAESINLMAKSLEELEREITCAMCLGHYTEPKVLPCCHYYCKQCIVKLAFRTDTDKPFSCPECCKEVTLPEGSVDQLQTAFIVYCFKTAFATLERAHGKVEVKCEACTDSAAKAAAFCRQCAMFICQDCIKFHQRLKVYTGHEVVSLEQLKQGRAREIVVKEPPAKKCVVHTEPLIVYCFDCDGFICHHCTVKDHKDHNFEFSKIAAPSTRKQLMDKSEELREVEASLSRAMEKIQTTKCELEAQRDSVANSIETSFEELLKTLDNCKRELLEDLARRVREKTDKLLLQGKDLSLASAEVHSVRDYTEQSVRHCANNDVMSMHAEMTKRLEQEIEEHRKRERSMEPVEGVDVGVEVRCAEVLQLLCQTKATITQLPINPAKCIVVVDGAITTEVIGLNKACIADLTFTRLANYQPTKFICKVDCHLKSLSNGCMVKCNADGTGPSNYSIRCTPTVRGRHELSVLVDGHKVAGSPFPVFVSIPPTQLGKPVRVLAGLSGPSGVTVNSVGEIVVTGYEGDVITFDREGNRLRNAKHNGSLYSVAVDGEDHIFCTDYDSNKIFTCNKNGGNVQLHEVKQVKGPGHLGVAVVGDEVMVCEHNSKGAIMVYDRELKYVRQIVGRDMGTFSDLSSDNHGNLYVTDRHNSCIRVFTKDGDYLRSFGCARNGVKKLYRPCGVCVAGLYVYVADDGNHNVSVFTTEGEYVTSFGQYGKMRGDFYNPCGVCVDDNGFLYVTDYNNNRVQIF